MRPRGSRSRLPWGLFVCVLLAPIAACTAVAGIGGFEVDPCFDGCDGGGEGGGGEGGSETSVSPEASTDSPVGPDVDGSTDSPVEAAACDCPSGTQAINGACAVTEAGAPSVHCTTPLQLPDNCAIKAIVHVCDGDPPFTISDATCDAGAPRPTGFVRLGKNAADGGKWSVKIIAAFSASRPTTVACTQGGQPCLAGGTASSNFTTTNSPSNDEIAVSKRSDVAGCQDIEIDVTPN